MGIVSSNIETGRTALYPFAWTSIETRTVQLVFSPHGICKCFKNQPAGCRSWILVPDTALTQITRAAFRGKQRNGRFHASLGSITGTPHDLWQGQALCLRPLWRRPCSCSFIHHWFFTLRPLCPRLF